MAQTLTSLLTHIIFSTKLREPLIDAKDEAALYAYIGGICRNHGSPLLDAGGTEDHVHLLVSLSKNIAVAELLLDVKRDSSSWMKTRDVARFGWQDGYAAFSIGQSQVEDLKRYLSRQKEHHKTKTFQEELLEFLRKYGIAYDERYLWT